MTITKVRTAVGDRQAALGMATYVLDPLDSPAAFDRPGDAETGRIPRPQAMWMGSSQALDRIGLARGQEVDAEHLATAFQGQHVTTGIQVRQPGSVPAVHRDGQPKLDEHGHPYREAVVNSYRPAFSAPKSVAVAWAHAGLVLRAQIEWAMMKAANAAIEHVVRTRNVVSGKEPAHGFAAAMTVHAKARNARGQAVPDPQLHVHIDLVGVLDAVGNLRTPNSAALFKDSAMREAGAVGRAVLAQELERLGFQIEARTGRGGRYFEIVGVPKGLCERHSGRGRDVAAWIEDRRAAVGAVSRREAAAAALLTRTTKPGDALSTQDIRRHWDAAAAEFGFGQAAVEKLRVGPSRRRELRRLRESAREAILQIVWQEGPTVSIGALRSIAFELAPMGLTLEQANDVIVQLQAEGELIALDEWRVTTRAIRDAELYVRDVARRAAGTTTAPLSAQAVAHGVRVAERRLDGHALDPEQLRAVDAVSSGAGWACLTGRAGTGKGPVLAAVTAAHRYEGWKIVACAVDGATAVRLGAQVRSDPLTLERLFHRLDRPGGLRIDERTLIVIDEASKVGLRDWRRLAGLVERTRARIVPVGDIGQIGAIECPGMFDVMLAKQSGIPVARLDTVRRHRDPTNPKELLHPWLGDYQRLLYERKADEAIDILRERGAITMHATRDEAMIRMVEKWADRRRDHEIEARDAVLVVHGSNDDVDRVNELAQAVRIGAGELRDDGVPAVDRDYRIHAGDVVMLREAAYQPRRGPRTDGPRVENGTMGVVERVDVARELVRVAFERPEGGTRSVLIDMRELRERWAQPRARDDRVPSLRLAYAGHPFPMQGATFKYVGSLWGRAPNRLDVYSGDTRAKLWLDVHVDRESAGWEGTDDDRYRRLARSLKRSAHRLASITYAEAPDVEVGTAIFEPERVPMSRTPAEGHGVERVDPAPAVVVDPLEQHRAVLGDERLAWVADRADALAEEMPELTADELHRARRRGEHALAQLDAAIDPATLSMDEELDLVTAGRHPSLWLDQHGGDFARGIAAARQLELERAIHGMAPIGRADVYVSDPLDRYRDLLGPDRTSRIARDADDIAAALPAGVERLRVERDQAASAFANLDRGGARETLRLERERRALEERVRTARPEEAALVRGDLARIARLTIAEQELRARGRHLDQWMDRNAKTAAHWVAVERELAARREVEIANHVERSLLNPHADVRRRIGPPPGRSAPERAEWEALARELERARITPAVYRRDGVEPAPRDATAQRRLERRVAKLAAERNLPPGRPHHGQGRDPPAIGR